MATADLVQLLISQINELDPTIDTSIGSNVRDLLINPISTLLTDYQSEHDQILNNLSLRDPSGLTEQELDAIGANFLVTRREGNYHTGTIKIFFNSAIPFSIPVNTRFIQPTTGFEYETTGPYTITRAAMLTNLDSNGFYSTADIPVRSVKRISAGALNQGAVLSAKSLTSPQPARVEVTTDIVGGTLRESNSSFYNRIKTSVLTSSLASADIIESQVKAESSAIEFVDVVGAGSPYMKRDKIAYSELTGATIENFQFVQSGLGTDVKFKQHQAYIDNFKVEVVASGQAQDIVWPTTPTEWKTEFTNEQYKGLFSLEDSLKATQDQYQIVSVSNWSESILDEWQKNDGARISNALRKPEEIRLDGSTVILGETPDPANTNPEASVTVDEIEELESQLIEARDSSDKEAINKILDQLAALRQPANYGNLSPVLHKNIKQHTGIDIDVTMSTTDSSEDGTMCYITVLRNDEIYIPFDGYGLAWRKQPGFITRLNEDAYGGDTEQRDADIAKFEDYFGVNPVDQNLVGNLSNPVNDQYWLYNMYMVDNNALDEDIIIGTTKVFDSMNGINQYLQRAKYWIEDGIDYDFRVEITNNLGTKIKVKENTAGTFDEIMDKGATYPSYVPNAGENINTGDSTVDALNSTRGHFGIGVLSTRGYEWTVKDTFVRSNTQTFPMHLFKFKIDYDKWAGGATDNFTVDYWGVGYDPNQYLVDGNTGNSRTQASIWNAGTSSWELLGTHTAEVSDSATSKKLSREFTGLSSYADTSDYIYIAASAANFGAGYEDNTDHNLITYYVQISNPDAGTIALGNAIDVYCHAPSQLKQGSAVYTADANGVINITEPYIADIVEVREALSNIAIPSSEYDIYNLKPGESFGLDNQIRIATSTAYDGAQLRVIYRHWSEASAINAFLNAPENRYPAVTVKEKAAPPTIITINSLEYSGDLDVNVAKAEMIDYINGIEDGVLEKSDLVQILNDLGATFVSLSMDIEIKQYDILFNYNISPFDSDRYTIPSNTIGYFYTDNTLVGGITKV